MSHSCTGEPYYTWVTGVDRAALAYPGLSRARRLHFTYDRQPGPRSFSKIKQRGRPFQHTVHSTIASTALLFYHPSVPLSSDRLFPFLHQQDRILVVGHPRLYTTPTSKSERTNP
jgi:hypothetical protein